MKDASRFVIEISTEGNTDVLNLCPELARLGKPLKGDGVIHLFVLGSTAALTTIEYEPGLVKHDLQAMFQRLAPDNIHYHHQATWHDDNGHAHIRAAMIGPSLTIPFHDGKLILGEYQQVILVDFDTRPRRRKIIGTVLG
jgi:secondary thiamine-phosphate synthase enzyme